MAGPATAGVAQSEYPMQAEEAVLELSAPSAGPATAGVAPSECVHESLIDKSVQHEVDNLEMYMGNGQVCDEYTGDALPAAMVAEAR